MPSSLARLWISSRMSTPSKLRTIASPSPPPAPPSSPGSAGAAAGGFSWHSTRVPCASTPASTTTSHHRPFTAPSSLLRRPVRRVTPHLLLSFPSQPGVPPRRCLPLLLQLLELLPHLGRQLRRRRGLPGRTWRSHRLPAGRYGDSR